MKLINKFFGDKSGIYLIYILLAIGVLLIVCAGSFSGSEKEPEAVLPEVTKTLEDRLSSILSSIKGAGQVDVLIVYKNDGEKSFKSDSDGKNQKTVILNKQGEEEALVTETTAPQIRGVLIVADGAGKLSVKESLIKSAEIALGIAPHKIVVYERTD